jgi:hypothetical protein
MDFEQMNVLSLSSMDNQGGHRVVCKMCIERSNHMPSTIELLKKTPKINYLNKHTNNIFVKVLACPCEYLDVIKFLVIHSNTMEAYTLWWNGATF